MSFQDLHTVAGVSMCVMMCGSELVQLEVLADHKLQFETLHCGKDIGAIICYLP